MPVTKIKVRFTSVDVLDDSDWLWGAGEWTLQATVDGHVVGDPNHEFGVHSGSGLNLPEVQWSHIVDVSGKAPGSSVEIRFKVIEKDVFSDDDLGEVRATIAYPFRNPRIDKSLLSPLIDGGWFCDDYRCYRLHFCVTIEEEFATSTTSGPTAIPVARTVAGGATFSTVKGTAFVPRIDVCPVVPMPASPGHMPARPALPAGLAAAAVPPVSTVTAAPTAPALNSMPNPSVIPILASGDPNLANKAARLAVTFYEPGNLDVSRLIWNVASGPAEIVGSPRGVFVLARGTGSAPDTMAVFEVRWETDSGPVLTTYRAWVGKVGTIPYRVNLLNGSTPALNVAGLMPPATVSSIMQVVQAIIYQAGILMVPDTNVTGYEGATLLPAGNTNAIFQLTVAKNQHTRLVNNDMVSRSTRYNYRPGVINIAFVHSTTGTNAAAVERNGIAGTASGTSVIGGNRFYKTNGVGGTKQLDGSPSSSWIDPSGVGLDAAGVKQTMKTIEPTDRVKQAAALDKSFVTARSTAAPPFTGAMMSQLYACHVPALWFLNAVPGTWTQAQYIWNCGINIAHELGHVLGLAHRGSGWSATAPLSGDGMDCKDQNGVMKGHPWAENIMTYGYGSTVPTAHDLDLLQASVVRAHPGITY